MLILTSHVQNTKKAQLTGASGLLLAYLPNVYQLIVLQW